MLNADQIVEKGLLKLEQSKGKKAQVGYDLSLQTVKKIRQNPQDKFGIVLQNKTNLADYTETEKVQLDGNMGWLLYPGTYEITFWEGCKLPADYVGLIRQRSSLLRNGTIIHSSVFDPGFETEFMGCVMRVNETIFIEEDTRVAQIYFHQCDEVSILYDGQWQNDKQRG
jgi:deoxycytidine triphosphate deaminase